MNIVPVPGVTILNPVSFPTHHSAKKKSFSDPPSHLFMSQLLDVITLS